MLTKKVRQNDLKLGQPLFLAETTYPDKASHVRHVSVYRSQRKLPHREHGISDVNTASQKWRTYRTIYSASLCSSTTVTCLIWLDKQQVYQLITDVKHQAVYYLLYLPYYIDLLYFCLHLLGSPWSHKMQCLFQPPYSYLEPVWHPLDLVSPRSPRWYLRKPSKQERKKNVF